MTGFARVIEMDAERRAAANKVVDGLIDTLPELFSLNELQPETRDRIRELWLHIVLRGSM